VASKEVKLGKNEGAIFKLHSLGVVTNRDEWVYGLTDEEVSQKVNFLINCYEIKRLNSNAADGGIKWTRAVKNDLSKNVNYVYDDNLIVDSIYRPFVARKLYFSQKLNEMQYKQREIFGIKAKNLAIGISGNPNAKPFQTLAVSIVPCLDLLEKTQFLPLFIYDKDGTRHDNITDWALKQFTEHYQNLTITKRDIFNYVYAVLHDPRYRQKFALNLKQEFPRIPFHPDFEKWADLGAQLIELHAHFENVTPFELQRLEIPTKTASKVRLKADKTQNRIEIDTNTHLTGIPPQASMPLS